MMDEQLDVLMSLNNSMNFTKSNSHHPGKDIAKDQLFFGYILWSFLVIFAIAMVFARLIDKRNKKAVCRILLPMQSFFQRLDWYEIGLQTGSNIFSGTTSNVFIRLICDNGTSPVYWLQDPTKPSCMIFMTNSVVYFMVPLPKHIGRPFRIHIWIDETGEQPSWFLKAVAIRNVLAEMNDAIVHPTMRWLSTSHQSSKPYAHISLRLSVDDDGTGTQSTSQSNKSIGIINVCIKEYHMWIGIFTSNALSRFSKQRRVIYSLFSTLLMSAVSIFIQKHDSMSVTISRNQLACIESVCLSNYHIIVAAQAVLMSLLPRIACCLVFERAENNIQGDEPTNQKYIDKSSDVNKQGRHRRKFGIKHKRRRNFAENLMTNDSSIDDGVKRSRSRKKIFPPRKWHVSSNGIHLTRNYVGKNNLKFMKRKPKSKARKLVSLVDFRKLPTIPENSVANFKTEAQILPKIPDALKESAKGTDCLTSRFGRIFSIMLMTSSGVLTFYMWSKSHSWSNDDDKDSIITVAVAILIDICIAQFLRPIFEGIRLFVVNQKGTDVMFGCPLSSLRSILIHLERRWENVHSSDVRTQYLSKIYDSNISIPVSRAQSRRKLKSIRVPRSLLIKELLHSLAFLIVFTIHTWQRIDSDEHILYQNMQEDWRKMDESSSLSMASSYRGWMDTHLLLFSHQRNAATSEGDKVILHSLKIQQRRLKKDLCPSEKLQGPSFQSCSLDLTSKGEDKASYEFNWLTVANKNKTINTTRGKVQKNAASSTPWQYSHQNSKHGDWAKKLLGIAVVEGGYEFVLYSKNTTPPNKQISSLASSSWLDDRTNEIMTNGIFLIPRNYIIIILHASIRRFQGLDKDLFIINGKVPTLSTWLCRAVISIFCITWIIKCIQSHSFKRLIFVFVVTLMFVAEFMHELAVEKALTSLKIDDERGLYEAIFYNKLLKIIQVLGTFLMAFHIAQLLMFMNGMQQIIQCFKSVVKVLISIKFLLLFTALILSHSIYISNHDTEQSFTNTLTALIAFIIGPGRSAGSKFSVMQGTNRISGFVLRVVLLSVKFILIAMLLSEIQYRVCIKSNSMKIEEEIEKKKKSQTEIHNELLKNFENTNIPKKKEKKMRADNKGGKLKSQKGVVDDEGCRLNSLSNEASKYINYLNSRISQVSMCLNENYLETVDWDIFLINLSFCLEKSTSVTLLLKSNLRPSESRRGKEKLATLRESKGTINSRHFGKERINFKLPLPQIKVRKELDDQTS